MESSAAMLQRLRFLKNKKSPCKTNRSAANYQPATTTLVCVNTAIKRNNALIFFGMMKALLLQKSNSSFNKGNNNRGLIMFEKVVITSERVT